MQDPSLIKDCEGGFELKAVNPIIIGCQTYIKLLS